VNRSRAMKLFVVTIAAFGAVAAAPSAMSHAAPGHPARSVTSQPAAQAHATLSTFAGKWFGHTRGLRIKPNGHAKEAIGDGCCDPVISLQFTLSHPHGTSHHARAEATVTKVKVHDKGDFSKKSPPPHVGEVRRIVLKRGVITERLTGTNYCDTAADNRGVCGA
jgi:hypothetical protein